jgi:hypothetical protein
MMKNQIPQALEKYLQAVERPRTYDTYDRARLTAYERLIEIFQKQNMLEKMDSLYLKRAQEFEKYPCFYADYGLFKTAYEGDYQAGIQNSKKALDNGCNDNLAHSAIGISYYMA